MAIQILRRNSGAGGAPGSLRSGQLAWNHTDAKLYYGDGDNGSGIATSILTVGGSGGFYPIATTLDQIAAPAADVSLNSHKITSLAAPVGANDAATKAYVDGVAQGLSVKASVYCATTTALPANTYNNSGGTLTANANGALPQIDSSGTGLANGTRILVKNETTAVNNGIYQITQGGGASTPWILTRTADLAVGANADGVFVFVEGGLTQGGSGWVDATSSLTNTVGTNGILWTQFSGAGTFTAGNGIAISGSLISANPASGGRIVTGVAGIDLGTTGIIAGTYYLACPQIDAYGRVVACTQGAARNGISLATGTISVATVSSSRITVGGSGIDLATSGVTAGAYACGSITVDAYGRVTAATASVDDGTF